MLRWWKTLLIKKRLKIVMIIMISVIVFQLIALVGSLGVFQSIRTLVAGEGHWSKAQKSALLNLTNYAMSGNRKDLDLFYLHAKVINGDKKARIELAQKSPRYNVVFDSLVEGKNHPNDVRTTIIFLRVAYNFEMVQSILREWEFGDYSFDKIFNLAKSVESKVNANGSFNELEFKYFLTSINEINADLTFAQNKFSTILLNSARHTEDVITVTLLSIVLSTFAIAYLLFLSLVKTFNKSMNSIRYSIGQAAEGNYEAFLSLKKHDDIGHLSLELNRLLKRLQEQMLGRLTAEVSEARLLILADAMPQIVMIRNDKGEIEFLNQRGWDFFKFKTKDVKNINPEDYIHENDLENAVSFFKGLRKENKIFERELRLRSKEGKYIWFLNRIVPVFSATGQVVSWYETLTDIDAQKNAHQELVNAVEMRDQFLSIASHELRTPLTSYSLQLQLRKRYIEKGDFEKFTPEKIEKMVKDDQKQVNKLVRLVDEMLDISRIRSGKLQLVMTQFDLHQLTIEVGERLMPQFESQGCKIIFKDSGPLIGEWDQSKIEQVVINLLTNALKYGNSKDVEIQFFEKGDQVGFSIKDQGIGISLTDQHRVFELFERIISPNSISGLGLGLYIVKQIIESHSGSIFLDSQLGSGSTFKVSLPRLIKL